MALRISLLKILLMLLNVLLTLIGVGLIALSVYELNRSRPGSIEHIAIVVQIFAGSFVVLTSFLGCVAAGRVSLGLIWSFVICIAILIILQIYIIVVAHSTDYVERARNDFLGIKSIQRMAYIEQTYSCCGKNGPQDYIIEGDAYPLSCYRDHKREYSQLFRAGCLPSVEKRAKQAAIQGLVVKWLLLLMEVCSLITAILLGITARNELRRERF